MDWYLNFRPDMSQVPDIADKVPFIQFPANPTLWSSGQLEAIDSLTDEQIAALGFSDPAEIRDTANENPGAYWYIFGEANRYGYMTGPSFAAVFRYWVELLETADPTAQIVGTSVLNWDYTCIGCGGLFSCEGTSLTGYPCGKVWLKQFISTYEATYGEKPPVDVWAIDTYPVDWTNTPNNDPEKLASYNGDDVLHSFIVTQQLLGLRQYLDTIPEYSGTRIWITEIAVHVGYDGWEFAPSPQIVPVGDYNWDKMSDYLTEVLDWLEANADANDIERWFFFTTWKDIVNVGGDGYMGIIFFDEPDQGASLNCLGDVYRARSIGAQPVKCSPDGSTVPE